MQQRIVAALQEHLRQAAGRDHAERVAVAAGVLGGDQPILGADARSVRAALGFEHRGVGFVELAGTEVAAQAKQVVQFVGVARLWTKRALDLGHGVGIEEVAQLLLAQQLAQQVTVERQRLRAPFGGRRVVLVHVGRDVVEEQRGRVRRCGRGLDVDEIQLARAQSVQQLLQRREVEDVLQALAVGLEDDRERAVLARDLEKRLRLETLLPQRRPLAGATPRDEQRTRRVLAKPRAEEGALPDLVHDEVLELVRADQQILGRRRRVGVGQVQRDAVVRPDRLHLDPERVAQPRGQRQRPRRVHARPERRQDAHAPVADLVTEALDHDRLVGRNHAGCGLLLVQEGQQVLRGPLVQPGIGQVGQSGLRRPAGDLA